MPHQIFISHATRDQAVAEAIAGRLESRGIACWMAPRDVRPGVPYPGEIARAITGSKVMILVLSDAANISPHVMREVGLAADCRLHIVQFCIEDVKPSDDLSYYLSLPHRIHALSDPLAKHLESLVKAVDGLLETWDRNRGVNSCSAPNSPVPSEAASLEAGAPKECKEAEVAGIAADRQVKRLVEMQEKRRKREASKEQEKQWAEEKEQPVIRPDSEEKLHNKAKEISRAKGMVVAKARKLPIVNKKFVLIAAVTALLAITSSVIMKGLPGGNSSRGGYKSETAWDDRDTETEVKSDNFTTEIDPPPAEDPPPPPPPPAPTFAVSFTKPKDTGDGYPYSSYRLSGGDLDGEVKSSANGTLAVTDAKPGSTYTLTLFGDLAGKNEIPLATAKLKLPEEPRQDTPLAVKLPTSLPALEIRNPYEYADYAQVAVVPPVSETDSASLATLSAQTPMAIEVMHLTPAPGLDKLPALAFPTKEKPLRLPALSSGNWSIRYTGSRLEERQEKVTTSASVRLTQKDVPKPLSGKFRALLPMTRFPDGKANPQLKPSAGVPRKNAKNEWEVDYFHRMVYPDYGQTFKALKHASNLGQRELPHYLAVLIELRLARDNAAASRAGLVRSSPALDLIYSKSDQIEISLPDGEERNDMKLVMFSSGGFYRNPQNELKRWVGMYEGKMSLPPGDAKQKAIHAFFEDSCLAALDFATGEKKLVGGFRELNSAMEVASWPVLNFPGNYEIELKRDGDNLMIHKVSELVTYEGLIHKDDKYLSPGDGSAIHSVIFDAELGVEPVRMELLD